MLILNAVDSGAQSKKDIAREFGIPQSTLSTILKHRNRLEKNSKESTPPSIKGRKRIRGGKHERLEVLLVEQLKKLEEDNQPITGRAVREKAGELVSSMGVTDLKCSNGWLHRLKLRHGFKLTKKFKSPNATKKESEVEEKYEDVYVNMEEDDELNKFKNDDYTEYEIDENLDGDEVEINEQIEVDDGVIESEGEGEMVEIISTIIEAEEHCQTPNNYSKIEYILGQYDPDASVDTRVQNLKRPSAMTSKPQPKSNVLLDNIPSSPLPIKEIRPKEQHQQHIASPERKISNLPPKQDVFRAINLLENVLKKINPSEDIKIAFKTIKETMDQTYPQYTQLKINDFFLKN